MTDDEQQQTGGGAMRVIGILVPMFLVMCAVIYSLADREINRPGAAVPVADTVPTRVMPPVEQLPPCDSPDVRRLAGIAATQSLGTTAALRQFEELPDTSSPARRECQAITWASTMGARNAWLKFFVEWDAPDRIRVSFPPQEYGFRGPNDR